MRIVLDTNVLVSALLCKNSAPAKLLTLWRTGKFALVTSTEQLQELRAVLRYDKIKSRISSAFAGRLVNELRDMATIVKPVPVIEGSKDPFDDYLLGTATASSADYLITGDKADLLSLGKYRGTKIVSVKQFLSITNSYE
jgi:putative PIN family toxin of toxin-antitoxin system